MWSQLSAEQKTNYGEEYFERALRSLEKYTEKVKWACDFNFIVFLIIFYTTAVNEHKKFKRSVENYI